MGAVGDRDRPPPKRRIWEDVFKIALYAILIALALRTFAVQPFFVSSTSMQPALMDGDYVATSKWAYGYSRHSVPFSPEILGEGRLFPREPERGDIVVFRAPQSGRQAYVKRVIGLPGDTVQMIDGALHLNGAPAGLRRLGERDAGGEVRYQVYVETLPGGRSYTIHRRASGSLDDTEIFQVPEGHYFMLGDNRSQSLDSRVGPPLGPGMVPARKLIGRAERVMVSVEPGFSLARPSSWANVRLDRFLHPVDDAPEAPDDVAPGEAP